MDFFDPVADGLRPAAWEIIRATNHLVWMILTKQPQRIADSLPQDWGDGWPNVWLGTSVTCHAAAWRLDALPENTSNSSLCVLRTACAKVLPMRISRAFN